MSGTSDISIRSLFHQGRFAEVLAQTVDDLDTSWMGTFDAEAIGALAFLGRLEEAEFRFVRLAPRLSTETQGACLFYLTVGYVRASAYAEARSRVLQTLKLARREGESSPLLWFYAYQGLAFYRHFCGRYARALEAAQKALESAIAAENYFARMLATDLLGHARVEMGEIARGLNELELAHRLAMRLGNGSTAKAIFKALVCYRAQYGLLEDQPLDTIHELIQQSRVQDTYTDSYMMLEYVRQLLLRARISDAEIWLDRASRAIYASRHRRQRVQMNLRWAELYFQKGESAQVHEKLDLARADIDPQVDLALDAMWHGMSLKCGRETSEDFIQSYRRKVLRLGTGLSLRISSRQLGHRHAMAAGEDKIGDLFENRPLQYELKSFQKILGSGYLSLIRPLLPTHGASNFIYLNAQAQTMIVGRSGDLFVSDMGSSTKIFQLLRRTALGPQSKEDLVRYIWEYDYNPLRHDAPLYSLVSRLRTLLGTFADWLENEDECYRLRADVALLEETRTPQLAALRMVETAPAPTNGLNERQMAILDRLTRETGLRLGPDECAEIFQVSKVTATRDLSGLFKAGRVQRFGKGPSTRYGWQPNQEIV